VREFAWLPRRLIGGRVVWLRSVLAVYAGKNTHPKPGGINRLEHKGYELPDPLYRVSTLSS
jgi:hypothetical protein